MILTAGKIYLIIFFILSINDFKNQCWYLKILIYHRNLQREISRINIYFSYVVNKRIP